MRLGQDPDALLVLLDVFETVGAASERPAQQSPGREFMTLREILNDKLGDAAGPNILDYLQLLVALDAENRVVQWCSTKAASASPQEQENFHLIRAELASQLGDEVAEISSLIDAAAVDPQAMKLGVSILPGQGRSGDDPDRQETCPLENAVTSTSGRRCPW